MTGTQQRARIPGLDGWRGIAVALVLLWHGAFTTQQADPFWVILVWSVPNGEVGVRIFFCLSGFLITHLLLQEESSYGKVSLANFFLRRALRILPVYLLYVATVAFSNAWLDWGLSLKNFITPLTMTTGLWLRRYNDEVFGHFWSLTVEEIFYLFWPFAFVLLPRVWRIVVVGSAILLLPLARMLSLGTVWEFYLMGFAVARCVDYLFMGCLAALIFQTAGQKPASNKTWKIILLPWIGLLCFAVGWVGQTHGANLGWSSVGWSRFVAGPGVTLMATGITLLILFTALRPESRLTKILETPALARLGTISYGAYVWQQLILLNPHLRTETWWYQFPANILITIAIAHLSYHFFEKRFLCLKEKFAKPTLAQMTLRRSRGT